MGRFLGKPDLESFPNAAKKGMKMFTNQQIHAVSGYERLYTLFWNRKAEELCRSPSYAKWSKNAITGVIATEWSLKKTALLFNHATRLMNQEPGSGAKRKQKADTVHQGALSMLNEHKNLLHLDEELRKLKRPDNTKRDKKKKIQAMEDAMQAKITELKKRQEALRKGLENMAKEKGANNTEIVKQMDVNTTQLDSSSVRPSSTQSCHNTTQGKAAVVKRVQTKRTVRQRKATVAAHLRIVLAKTVPTKRKVNGNATVAAQMRIVVALIITVQTERRVSGTATATTRASKVRESAKKWTKSIIHY